MSTPNKSRRAFIESLARENRKFYGSPDGWGLLRAFDLTFEHRWIYLFELVQNALDAGARSIAARLSEGERTLIFQHDGTSAISEKNVEGLSKVFRSTKGASSVGFMGLGFKSVFGRFGEARISGWGWTFRYEVRQVKGERFGDVQRDLLGAVIPVWDEAIEAPEAGFTTRFEMRHPVDSATNLRADLEHFLPDDDRTLLAVLADSGLERLEVNGCVWELGVRAEPDGSREATALSPDEDRLWQLFSVPFEPSPDAVARFLEHRRIQPTAEEREQVYAEAARPRRILGVLPLDDNGIPVPPKRGRVYATMPMEVTLPFGLHVNADWLPNISRTGLLEIDENTWQREIVDRIAEVLASHLRWVACTLSTPEAAKAAFTALAPPSPEASRIEALLDKEHWLSRLRSRIEDEAVLPVWTEETDALGFARPEDVIVPPAPLADAFDRQQDLRPAVLLNGPVLVPEVLGDGAYRLLERIGLLDEMSHQDLDRAWSAGLEKWWESLDGADPVRRDLVFHLWGAVSRLASEEGWPTTRLPCVRTVSGRWLSVTEATFFNERLPSEREPGGPETLQFLRPFLPDRSYWLVPAWVRALRQEAGKEGSERTHFRERGPLSWAWMWIEEHARRIDLRDVVESAGNDLVSSSAPDWSALVPLGRWALHRKSSRLLIHVLAESTTGSMRRGVRIDKAILADPYVERGQARRHLFPAQPVISASYLNQDPSSAGAPDWRKFFEEAGAKGKIDVRPSESHVSRWEPRRVAEFLGEDEVGESNDSGYTLVDFDIEPALPDAGAPEELRAALAPWLDDGFSVLTGKGRRRTSYFYYSGYSKTGSVPCAWVNKLTDLEWVSCTSDDHLRRPQDVLPQSDPTREDVPVARLSSELLSVLEQEGVKFGAAIHEATPLHRLSTMGSRLDADELAALLREVREQIAPAEDRHRYERAVKGLTVPSSDNTRVPVTRIVRRAGGPRRGTLGGWIVPLGRIHEGLREELEHADFPRVVPDTTTGGQALTYLQEVWDRARSSPERLANEVRDVLPAAYAYCLEDRAGDESLSERWDTAVSEAAVFAEREWVSLSESKNVYFDDLEDRRFFPSQGSLRVATGGHLGNSPSDRIRTAEALRLPLLSSSVSLEWHEDGASPPTAGWNLRLDLICKLLGRVRRDERAESDNAGVEIKTTLRACRRLSLKVSVEGAAPEQMPVNARLHRSVLTVAGRPVQFGADAAKELLRSFSFGQRGDLAADLTGRSPAVSPSLAILISRAGISAAATRRPDRRV